MLTLDQQRAIRDLKNQYKFHQKTQQSVGVSFISGWKSVYADVLRVFLISIGIKGKHKSWINITHKQKRQYGREKEQINKHTTSSSLSVRSA